MLLLTICSPLGEKMCRTLSLRVSMSSWRTCEAAPRRTMLVARGVPLSLAIWSALMIMALPKEFSSLMILLMSG